jgi:hypothetical protein
MERPLIETMLSFSSEACIVLDWTLQVVAGNDRARSSFALQAGDAFLDWVVNTPEGQRQLASCFSSTAQVRFGVQTVSGQGLTAFAWRLGGAFKPRDLIAIKLVEPLRIKTEFVNMTAAHRTNLQRVKRQHLQNQLLATQVETDHMTGLLNAHGMRRKMQNAVAIKCLLRFSISTRTAPRRSMMPWGMTLAIRRSRRWPRRSRKTLATAFLRPVSAVTNSPCGPFTSGPPTSCATSAKRSQPLLRNTVSHCWATECTSYPQRWESPAPPVTGSRSSRLRRPPAARCTTANAWCRRP